MLLLEGRVESTNLRTLSTLSASTGSSVATGVAYFGSEAGPLRLVTMRTKVAAIRPPMRSPTVQPFTKELAYKGAS